MRVERGDALVEFGVALWASSKLIALAAVKICNDPFTSISRRARCRRSQRMSASGSRVRTGGPFSFLGLWPLFRFIFS